MIWKDVFAAIKQTLLLSEQTQQNKEDVKEVRREMRALEDRVEHLSVLVIQLAQELQSHKKESNVTQENLALRLENELLKFERRLPSGDIMKEDKE